MALASIRRRSGAFLGRLGRDTAGNTLAIIAAALIPLLAIVGGGVDASRGYLAQSRLQQACDAGVLAARKRIGSAVDAGLSPDATKAGNSLFNINFGDGIYGTSQRAFAMTLQPDYSVAGVASVVVPTTIMNLFGYTQIPLNVTCEARINMSNTDVMMVLDVTGSMAQTNPGDTMSKIDALKATVKSFYTQLTSNAAPSTRIRFGFVPYATNVNVGGLLDKNWIADSWHYNTRTAVPTGSTTSTGTTYETKTVEISGSVTTDATYYDTSCPANTYVRQQLSQTTNADGWTITRYQEDGSIYSCSALDASSYKISPRTYNAHVYEVWRRPNGTATWTTPTGEWSYDTVDIDTSWVKGKNPTKAFAINGNPGAPSNVSVGWRGCIEERATYEIDDYAHVDLSRALDLDLDLVPSPSKPETQWKPVLHELSFERQMGAGKNQFDSAPIQTGYNYMNAAWWGNSDCPAPARKLATMTGAEVDSYLATLKPYGSTYHDIGMIWGGRLISPTGIFAADNADVNGQPTNRNLIFLTDGETAPLDIAYGAYGIEPLDKRRWSPSSKFTLTQTVENRFTVACNEVKKRNITVWFVAFGTTLNPMMTDCAGPGHYFQANNAADLDKAFTDIAKHMGDLRISK